jgi:hypothetical protein
MVRRFLLNWLLRYLRECPRFWSRLRPLVAPHCKLNEETYNDGAKRVENIARESVDCACENGRFSFASPGPVLNGETLVRFLWSPLNFDKKGSIKNNVFGHVFTHGCSVQREQHSTSKDAIGALRTLKGEKTDFAFRGVIEFKASDVRRLISTGIVNPRLFCVYDTAEPNNPGHAEVCVALPKMGPGVEQQLRRTLQIALLSNGHKAASQYRGGDVLRGLV